MAELDDEPLERVLAKVVRLGSTSKHPAADHLQIGQVGGWKTVVGATAKEGDLGIYFEVDSCLPEADWVRALGLPRLKALCQRPIITTKKIRGELSQGLFLTMEQVCLPSSTTEDEEKWLKKGDVTELLGVTKTPEPKDIIPLRGDERVRYGDVFRCGPPKTNELRVQSYMHFLDQLKGLSYYITLKIDGTSATYGFDEKWGGLMVCSRNYLLSKEEREGTFYGIIAKQYNLEEKLVKHLNLVIQGEIYGKGVRKNLLVEQGLKLGIFTIYDKEKKTLLRFEELEQTCNTLGLPMVPVEEVGNNFTYSMTELLVKAKGFYPKTKNHREGLVVRSQAKSPPISFKVINNNFLLQQESCKISCKGSNK